MLLGSSDERLVELVLDGDDEAFEVLFDRHVADAVWFARDVLGSWGEAEEAVRHSFAAARAYMGSRSRDVEFAPWLHTILSNHCLSMLQARGPRPGETAAVVDLDEWRRQRRRLGAVAPVAIGAGLRDSVMAACGVGAAATASGASALGGGTLVKLAVTAVLAGSVGVAGQAAMEERDASRGGPPADAAAGSRANPPTDGLGSGRVGDLTLAGVPSATERRRDGRVMGRGSRPLSAAGKPDTPSSSPRRGEQPRTGRGPSALGPGAHESPVGDAPPGAGGAPGASARMPPGTAGETLAGAPRAPLRDTLSGVADTVRRVVPAPASAGTPQTPTAVSVIGDDLRVTADQLTSHVRALLSQGSNAPAR